MPIPLRFSVLAMLISAAALPSSAFAVEGKLTRTDRMVPSDAGVSLFVREVRQPGSVGGRAVLLIHGARVPGIPSFDLPVKGGSLASDLARAGHRVFIMDARGYGRSSRPPEMSAPRRFERTLVRSGLVVRDVSAVVDAVRRLTGNDKVALLGWASGGHWAGMYASLYPGKVSHFIAYNTLYGGTAGHKIIGRGSRLSETKRPGRFNMKRFGNYRLSTADSLLRGWTRSIPVDDKASWRDPEVARAYVKAALASDSTSQDRSPASFRAPSGAMEDSFLLAVGHQFWDASLITGNILIVRSARDFWSRPSDAIKLKADALQAKHVSVVTIPRATHFVHLDRPAAGRSMFIRSVLQFLERD